MELIKNIMKFISLKNKDLSNNWTVFQLNSPLAALEETRFEIDEIWEKCYTFKNKNYKKRIRLVRYPNMHSPEIQVQISTIRQTNIKMPVWAGTEGGGYVWESVSDGHEYRVMDYMQAIKKYIL